VFVNESQDALVADFLTFLESVIDPDMQWRHDDPEHSDCDRRNTDSHLRALLLSPCVTLQVSGGELVLGQWQRVLIAELDGPRTRTLRLQVMGVL
jgi:secondary thiamine-phosphate synthase enzyme